MCKLKGERVTAIGGMTRLALGGKRINPSEGFKEGTAEAPRGGQTGGKGEFGGR